MNKEKFLNPIENCMNYVDPEYKWYNPYLYYLRNPAKLIKSPLGWLLGKIIVFEQKRFSNKHYALTTLNGYRANYRLAKSDNNPEEPIEKRKINVLFAGNGYDFTHVDPHYDKPNHNMSKFINRFKQELRDVATVYHPRNATSIEAEVECGETLIKALLSMGYKPENITIIGASLGGGVAAMVLDRFRKNGVLENNEAFEHYINYKSFSYLSYAVNFIIFLGFWYGYKENEGGEYSIKNDKIVKFSSLLLSKFLDYFGWEIPTAEILNHKDLPVNKITIISSENDDVIGNLSAINYDTIDQPEKINFSRIQDYHMSFNKGLFDDDLKKYNIERKPEKFTNNSKKNIYKKITSIFTLNNILNTILLFVCGAFLSRIFISKALPIIAENGTKIPAFLNSFAKGGNVTKYYVEQTLSKIHSITK